MKIEQKQIDSVLPYEFNNRKHNETQVERIAKSIKEFGFNQPIVTDEDNIILVGHGRLLAARALGLDKVPVVQLKELSEENKKAYRILDNKLQNDSTWDFDNIGLELGFLEDQGFDLEGWGLDELKDLFPIDEPEVTEDEGAGELPYETYIKLGDLIELGKHRVLCGDSTSAEDVAELMDGHKADMVFTDPPYGVSYQSNMRTQSEKFDVLENDDKLITDWIPLLEDYSNGFVFIWTSWKVLGKWLSALAELGEPTNLIVWDKGGGGIGDLTGTFSTDFELALVYNRSAKIQNKRIGSVWSIGKDAAASYLHPTQKPVELAAQAMKHTCSKGASVLDLFLGSGSTLIAADQLNRVCYGMELEPKYCQVIIERYQKYCLERNKPFECRINGVEFKGQNDQEKRETAL